MRNLVLPLFLSSLLPALTLLAGCTGQVLTVDVVDLSPDAGSGTSGPRRDASRGETTTAEAGDSRQADGAAEGAASVDATTEGSLANDAHASDATAGDVGSDTSVATPPDATSPPPSDAGADDAKDAALDHSSGGGGGEDATADVHTNPMTTIGGIVSGLAAGDTVVLQDNGGNSTTLTGSPTSSHVPFTFSSPVPVGSTYDVTVFTQPANPVEECSVVKGTGIAPNLAVTTISVTCVPTPETVSAILTGLAPEEIVTLLLNGGDALTLTTNGTFPFMTPAAPGYMVTIQSNPSGPIAQSCAVNASGSPWSVDVGCAATPFPVGGIITGLVSPATVVLQDNGGGVSTDFPSNGPFMLPTLVPSGQPYDVMTPSSNTSCTVIPPTGSGTVGTGPVTSVRVQCGEVTLTPPQTGSAGGVASDGTYVYWASSNAASGTIWKSPIAGGSVSAVFTKAGTHPTGLALGMLAMGTQYLYWTDSVAGTVLRLSTSLGTGAQPSIIAEGQNNPMGIALTPDGSTVVWTNSVAGGTITSAPAASVNGLGATVLSSGNAFPTGVATDGTNVYWTNYGTTTAPGAVWATSLASGTTTGEGTLIASGTSPLGIVVTGGYVYWTDPGAGTVSAASATLAPANHTVAIVATNLATPEYLATNSGYVYWTSLTQPNSVFSVDISAGPPTLVAPTLVAASATSATFVAVDDTNVYWTSASSAAVYEAPK